MFTFSTLHYLRSIVQCHILSLRLLQPMSRLLLLVLLPFISGESENEIGEIVLSPHGMGKDHTQRVVLPGMLFIDSLFLEVASTQKLEMFMRRLNMFHPFFWNTLQWTWTIKVWIRSWKNHNHFEWATVTFLLFRAFFSTRAPTNTDRRSPRYTKVKIIKKYEIVG